MKLYGTPTSPYVRRVRVIALELGVETTIVDTSTEAGQAALRAHAPLMKIPTAELDGQVIWDSVAITDYLLASRGSGALRPARDLVAETKLRLAIDGALDAAINVFYLEREGLSASSVPYLAKQNERVARALAYVAGSLHEGYCTEARAFGVTELALVTALDWLVFRERFDVASLPPLAEALRVHADRPSLVATRPG